MCERLAYDSEMAGPRITILGAFLFASILLTANPAPSRQLEQAVQHGTSASDMQRGVTLDLPRLPWEGGPNYWSQFAKARAAGWSRPTFFPIGVFLSRPRDARTLASIGINTYVAADHHPPISQATRNGLFVIAQYVVPDDQDGWKDAEIGNDPRVVGWFLGDECDMGYCGGANEADYLRILRGRAADRRARRDGRFVFTNFGNGVLRTHWSPTKTDDMLRVVDAASVDKYAYSSPQVRFEYSRSDAWPSDASAAQTSAAYGWLIKQLRSLDNPKRRRPLWLIVETRKPLTKEHGSRAITPNELEGAVWAGIINEARGITYFQHNNDGLCGLYSIVECRGLKDRLRVINRKIRSLAPVINTQSYRFDFRNGTTTMLKTHGAFAYVFAGVGVRQRPGLKHFRLPKGINGTRATVVGENRVVPVVDGRFSDTFRSEYTHHVYRIPLRAR